MYWYVKYPLIVILVCAILGIGVLIWRSVHGGKTAEPQPVVVMPEDTSNAPAGSVIAEPTASSAPKPSLPPALANNDYSRLEEQLRLAEEQLNAGSLDGARRLAAIAMQMDGCVEFDKYWFRAFDTINEVNRRFMNSTAPCPEKKRHTVQSGDTLGRIAATYFTSVNALVRLNNLADGNGTIHPHQVVSWLDGAWSIRVSKQHYVLILYFNKKPYRYYRVGIGREDRTPAGTFLISSRIAHPDWTPPGKHIPYGNPENVLGTHWLGLTPVGDTDSTLSGYGIHGTWEPDSIGKAASSGCVRMRNEDVEELFDFIPEPGGTCPPVSVTIEE